MRNGLMFVKTGATPPQKTLEGIRKVEGILDYSRFDIVVLLEVQ